MMTLTVARAVLLDTGTERIGDGPVNAHHHLLQQTFAMPSGVKVAGAGGDEPDEHGLGIHAGYSGTSLVLHLRPDLVDMASAARNVPTHIAELTHLGFGGTTAQFGWLSDDFTHQAAAS